MVLNQERIKQIAISLVLVLSIYESPNCSSKFQVTIQDRTSKMTCNYYGFILTAKEDSLFYLQSARNALDSVRCIYSTRKDTLSAFATDFRKGSRGAKIVTPMVYAYWQIMAIDPFPMKNQNQLADDGISAHGESIKISYLNKKEEEELQYEKPGNHLRKEDQIMQRILDIMLDVRRFQFKIGRE